MADTTTMTVSSLPLRGIDQRHKPPGGFAAVMQDLTQTDHGGWRDGGGYARCIAGPTMGAVDPFSGMGQILSLFSFWQGGMGRHWLVFEATLGNSETASLCVLDPSTRTSTCYAVLKDRSATSLDARTAPSTPWAGTVATAWGDRLYLVNGYDAPVVFDGWRADEAGFANPPPPPSVERVLNVRGTAYGRNTVTSMTADGNPIPSLGLGPVPTIVDEGGGTLTITPYNCAYRYIMAYKNDRGQLSPWSEPSETVYFSNGDIKITGTVSSIANGAAIVGINAPIGPAQASARVFARTINMLDSQGQPILGAGDVFYYLCELPDNTTRFFEDYQPDGSLGSAIDRFGETGAWPRGASIVCVFKERMYFGGMAEVDVAFSYAGFPEQVPGGNTLALQDASGGRTTGLWPGRNCILATKARSLHLIKEDDELGPRAWPLSGEGGCIAPKSFVDIPKVGTAFIGDHAIYLLQGALLNEPTATEVIRISTPIPDIIASLNWSAMIGACSGLNLNEQEAWFCVPWRGYQNNTHVLKYHYETGDWTIVPYMPIQCLAVTQDRRSYVYFGSWATDALTSPDGVAHEGIFVYSLGYDNKASTRIQPVYETAPADYGYLYRNVAVAEVMVYCVGFGQDLTLDYRVNRDNTWIRADLDGSDAFSRDQQYADANHRMDIYGTTAGRNNVAVWGTSTWGSWRPVVLRFPISLTPASPAQELSLRFSPLYDADVPQGTQPIAVRRIELIGIDTEIRTGEPRKRKPIADVVG